MLRSSCVKCKNFLQTQYPVSGCVKCKNSLQTQFPVWKKMASWVEGELGKNSTERLYIEYSGFLSNHVSHAIIALGRLHADLAYVHEHVRHQREKLEGRDGPTANNQQADTEQEISDLLGQRKAFYQIKKYYEDVLQNKHNNCLETLVREEFNKLYLGMGGSALHGLIHTGYGVCQRSAIVVCEGLSYLHHSYTPVVFSSPPPVLTLGHGSSSLLQVLLDIRQDKELRKFMMKESGEDWVKQRGLGSFQNRVLALVTKRGDELVKYAHMVKAPPDALKNETSLAAWLLESSILLYQTSTATNDFFLLHGVTATWALTNILQVLRNKSQMLEVLRVHLTLMMAVYLARDAPQLDMNLQDGEDSHNMTDEDIRIMVLKLPAETDEHVFKLVQVCLDTARAKNEDEALGRLCRTAALTAIKYPLKIFL